MSIHCLIKIFISFVVLWCIYNVYQSEKIIFQTNKFNIEIIIEYITNYQLYIQEKIIKFIHLNICKENNEIKDLLLEYSKECPDHQYKIRIIERSPLIIYIHQFLTKNEINHLIKLAEPLYKRSMIYDVNGSFSFDEHRTSTSAILKRHQTSIVKCIEKRFAQFQGDIQLEFIEPLQIVKYDSDQQYKPHYDWFEHVDLMKNGGQRVTTFFTYLQSNCSMGETEFLDIKFNKTFHQRFCDILICDQISEQFGIRFRPLIGNTIFWYNLDEFGQNDYLTYHAGRPPGQNGYKIGLNTWTRLKPHYPPLNK